MFYNIFKQLCDERGVSVSRACIEMGLSRSIAAKWKSTKTNPSADVLPAIANYFGVTIDYLLGQETKKSPDTESGEEIPHGKMRQVLSEGGIRVYLDEDANVPQENLEDIIKYIKLRQRDVGR